MNDPLKDAMMRRRGKAIDLSIIISPPQAEEKGGDMAPPGHMDESQDKESMKKRMSGHEMEEREEPSSGFDDSQDLDEEMVAGIDDNEAKSLKEGGKKMSLMELAKLEAMKRKGKA